jgi:hypothetical protein
MNAALTPIVELPAGETIKLSSTPADVTFWDDEIVAVGVTEPVDRDVYVADGVLLGVTLRDTVTVFETEFVTVADTELVFETVPDTLLELELVDVSDTLLECVGEADLELVRVGVMLREFVTVGSTEFVRDGLLVLVTVLLTE